MSFYFCSIFFLHLYHWCCICLHLSCMFRYINLFIYTLFIVYYVNNHYVVLYLSVALSATKTGCVINDKSVNHVFYADDLCIMSASPAGLQKLIDICYNYSVQNYLTFNVTKSGCVVFKPKV